MYTYLEPSTCLFLIYIVKFLIKTKLSLFPHIEVSLIQEVKEVSFHV